MRAKAGWGNWERISGTKHFALFGKCGLQSPAGNFGEIIVCCVMYNKAERSWFFLSIKYSI